MPLLPFLEVVLALEIVQTAAFPNTHVPTSSIMSLISHPHVPDVTPQQAWN